MLIAEVVSLSESLSGQNSLRLLTAIALFCFVSTAAILAADTISSERRNRTLGILRLTPLKPSALLLGKLISNSTHFVLCLIAIAPILAISILKGGLVWYDVSIQLLKIFAMVLLALSVSLFYSTICRHVVSSTVLSLITLGVCYILSIDLPYLCSLGLSFLDYQFGTFPESFQYFHQYLGHRWYNYLSDMRDLLILGSAFGLALLFFALAWLGFRLIWKKESDPGRRIFGSRNTKNPAILPFNRPLMRFEDDRNPLDQLSWHLGSHWFRRLFVYLSTGGCLCLSVLIFVHSEWIFFGYLGIFLLELIFRLYAALDTPGPIREMRASGWLDLLLTVPNNSRLVIEGILSTLKRSQDGIFNSLIIYHVLLMAFMMIPLALLEDSEAVMGLVLMFHIGSCFLIWLEFHSLRTLGFWLGLRLSGRMLTSGIVGFCFCLIPPASLIACIFLYEVCISFDFDSTIHPWIVIWFGIRISWAVFWHLLAKNHLKTFQVALNGE